MKNSISKSVPGILAVGVAAIANGSISVTGPDSFSPMSPINVGEIVFRPSPPPSPN